MTETTAGTDTVRLHFKGRADAASYVQERYGFSCSRQWLAKLAVVGGGPVFRKAGRTPIYAPDDLDAWAVARIGAPLRSTSDTISTKVTSSPAGPERNGVR